jgi:hypothetical protein
LELGLGLQASELELAAPLGGTQKEWAHDPSAALSRLQWGTLFLEQVVLLVRLHPAAPVVRMPAKLHAVVLAPILVGCYLLPLMLVSEQLIAALTAVAHVEHAAT